MSLADSDVLVKGVEPGLCDGRIEVREGVDCCRCSGVGVESRRVVVEEKGSVGGEDGSVRLRLWVRGKGGEVGGMDQGLCQSSGHAVAGASSSG